VEYISLDVLDSGNAGNVWFDVETGADFYV
jgi:hypothetical protein